MDTIAEALAALEGSYIKVGVDTTGTLGWWAQFWEAGHEEPTLWAMDCYDLAQAMDDLEYLVNDNLRTVVF